MNPQLFISLLLATIIFDETSAQFNNFQMALKNDLDADCVKDKGYTLASAVKIAEDCVKAEMNKGWNLQQKVNILCNSDAVDKCFVKYFDVVKTCLDEDLHDILNVMASMDYESAMTLCANNAKNLKAMGQMSCYSYNSMIMAMNQCEYAVMEGASTGHVKDLFTAANCQKYETYYKCNKDAAAKCYDIKNVFIDIHNAAAEESQCNN